MTSVVYNVELSAGRKQCLGDLSCGNTRATRAKELNRFSLPGLSNVSRQAILCDIYGEHIQPMLYIGTIVAG